MQVLGIIACFLTSKIVQRAYKNTDDWNKNSLTDILQRYCRFPSRHAVKPISQQSKSLKFFGFPEHIKDVYTVLQCVKHAIIALVL